MRKQTFNTELYSALQSVVGESNISRDTERLKMAARDHTEDLEFMPQVVVHPGSTSEISDILKLSNRYHVPVTPRGGGTGVSGGALPIHGGIVLHMNRFNRILDIDKVNRCAMVEAGVITQVFQEAVEDQGLFFPPDPGSRGSCFLGGNLAESSGGPRSLKYGVTRDYVLNMEVVLPSGDIVWTGKDVTKNATGYDLNNLICGSEGTLGIITKIVFKLIPPPKHEILLLLPFQESAKAPQTVKLVAAHGFAPVSMEFIDKASIDIILQQHTWPKHQEGTEAYLWIEFDGDTPDLALDQASLVLDMLEQNDINTQHAVVGQSDTEKNNLWTMRRLVGESIISYTTFKDIDAVVPVSKVDVLLKKLWQIESDHGFQTACFGHIGNGNLHIQILKENLSDTAWQVNVKHGVRALFEVVRDLGGSLSGEHGVGYLQKEFMPIIVPEASIQLMKQIKAVFDPNNILNPGKIF